MQGHVRDGQLNAGPYACAWVRKVIKKVSGSHWDVFAHNCKCVCVCVYSVTRNVLHTDEEGHKTCSLARATVHLHRVCCRWVSHHAVFNKQDVGGTLLNKNTPELRAAWGPTSEGRWRQKSGKERDWCLFWNRSFMTDNSFTASRAIWAEVEIVYLEVCLTIVGIFIHLSDLLLCDIGLRLSSPTWKGACLMGALSKLLCKLNANGQLLQILKPKVDVAAIIALILLSQDHNSYQLSVILLSKDNSSLEPFHSRFIFSLSQRHKTLLYQDNEINISRY